MMHHNRWIIAFACAWVNFFIFAVFRSSGFIYVKVIDLFNSTHQQAAFSVSLTGSVASTTGMASGFLTHYLAPRTIILMGVCICSISVCLTFLARSINFVIITIGILQGIGIGFVTCLLPAVLSAHFKDQKSIALGISYAGATLGAFVFPLLIKWMFLEYGFHGTMLIIGGIVMNAVAGAILLRLPDEKQKEPEQKQLTAVRLETATPINPDTTTTETSNGFFQRFKQNLINDYRLLSNFYFFLCSFTYINFIIDFIAFIIILPDVAKDRQVEDADAKWLFSIFAVTDFLGRLVPGWLSHWNLTTDKLTYIITSLGLGTCMILLVIIESWWSFVTVTLICGFVTGCQMVLSPAVLADYYGGENTAIAFGMENFVCGILSIFLRPMIIGMKDVYGNYNMLGVILFTSVSINFILWIGQLVHQKMNNNNIL